MVLSFSEENMSRCSFHNIPNISLYSKFPRFFFSPDRRVESLITEESEHTVGLPSLDVEAISQTCSPEVKHIAHCSCFITAQSRQRALLLVHARKMHISSRHFAYIQGISLCFHPEID
ncbi:hypothetical protein GDO81_006911 [Engystomops pustulosus]|uniref:Uncharacterized protein n=1 Tax=Engystomops pustulosus TaxID=76066 RepID=A0AAV7D3V8_ENGPU|nr:hypothetical protein GDO81_006911 [Engystomops pustulosus]